MQLSSVVLPQPDWPMMATISPRGTSSDTPRSACTCVPPLEYVLTTPLRSMMVVAASATAVAAATTSFVRS